MNTKIDALVLERDGKQKQLDRLKHRVCKLRSELMDCEETIRVWTQDIQKLDCEIENLRKMQSEDD